jgi:hypothetical protein
VDLVRDRFLANHPQDVAVQELEMAPCHRVQLDASVPEQLEGRQEEGEVGPREPNGLFR